jgi:hypothetical protein
LCASIKVQFKEVERDARVVLHTSLLLTACVAVAPEMRVGAAKSNVCNHEAVYKWWWGNVGSKTKEQSRTRTKNRVEQCRTKSNVCNHEAVYKWWWGYIPHVPQHSIVDQYGLFAETAARVLAALPCGCGDTYQFVAGDGL